MSMILDLDAERATRAASREGKKIDLPIVIGGKTIAVLPVEMPLDVLSPLRRLDADFTLLLRQAFQSQQGITSVDTTALVIDVIANNPALPVEVLDIFRDVAVGLLGEEGLTALQAARPTAQDYAALTKGAFDFYGVSLGESSGSSDSPTDGGGTSNTTSSGTSDSTPEVSGPDPETPGSSEPVAS